MRSLVAFLRTKYGVVPAVSEVTPWDIQAWMADMQARGLAPETIKGYFGALRAFFRWAEDWELIEKKKSPMRPFKSPKVPDKAKEFLSKAQFEALLAVCDQITLIGWRRRSELLLLATTGLRLYEMSELRLEDIDWQHGLIRILRGKGQRARWVPLHRDVQRSLWRYLAIRTDDSEWLWVHVSGKRLRYNGIAMDTVRLYERAGFRVKDRHHVLRRTWAAHAARQKIPLQHIMGIGGWRTPRMVMHYTRLMLQEDEARESFKDFDPYA